MSEARFTVRLSETTLSYLRTLSPAVLRKCAHSIDLLETMPFIGRIYEPEYEAAPIPVPCRFFTVPGTTAQLFYTVDEEKKHVAVLWACDGRADPLTRFTRW